MHPLYALAAEAATTGAASEHATTEAGGANITLGQHAFWHVPFIGGGGGDIHADTVISSAIIMVLLLVIFSALAKTVNPVPSEQSGPAGRIIEGVVEFCQKIITDFIGPNVDKYLWYVGSIFIFVLAANWLSLLPWRAWEIVAGEQLAHAIGTSYPISYDAPTADINMTGAMAVLSLILYWVYGISHGGFGKFLSHHWFAKPVALFPLRILEDFTRPFGLALRLFANITAGHVVGLVLLMLVPFIIPSVMLPMELFVGAVQAFIFAVLSASYIGAAVADHHESH